MICQLVWSSGCLGDAGAYRCDSATKRRNGNRNSRDASQSRSEWDESIAGLVIGSVVGVPSVARRQRRLRTINTSIGSTVTIVTTLAITAGRFRTVTDRPAAKLGAAADVR